MTKKQLYIIVGVIIIVALGFLLAFFLISKQNPQADGAVKTNIFANFFPFGKSTPKKTAETGAETTETGNGNTETNPQEKIFSILRQVTDKPTAGLFPYEKTGKTYVEYVEKESGNVYEVKMEDMSVGRLSHSLITRVSEAFFGNDGKSVVLRYIKNNSETVTSFILDLSKAVRESVSEAAATTTPSSEASFPNGKFLASGISNVKVSSDTKSLFYFTKTSDFENRVAVGSLFDFQKNTFKDVFLSPFSEWLPLYSDNSVALLQTKASQNVPGFLYLFNIKSGDLQKILGDIPGLTALPSPDNQKILYSKSNRGGLTLHIYDRKTSKTTDVSVQTLPEKCVWKKDNVSIYCAVPNPLPGGEYPDAWYQGIVSFNDNIWKIDSSTGEAVSFFVPQSLTVQLLDMTNLSLSPSEDFLFFISKRDSSLWAFDLLNGEEE